jgi:hypothetical protein
VRSKVRKEPGGPRPKSGKRARNPEGMPCTQPTSQGWEYRVSDDETCLLLFTLLNLDRITTVVSWFKRSTGGDLPEPNGAPTLRESDPAPRPSRASGSEDNYAALISNFGGSDLDSGLTRTKTSCLWSHPSASPLCWQIFRVMFEFGR